MVVRSTRQTKDSITGDFRVFAQLFVLSRPESLQSLPDSGNMTP